MIFNLESGHKLKIELQKIQKHRRFKNSYRYKSSSYILYNEEWYTCHPEISQRQLIINGLFKYHKGSDTSVEEYIKDFRVQEPITSFKDKLIRLYLQEHPLNRFMLKFRRGYKERKKTVFVFSLAIALSVVYYFVNTMSGNAVMNWFANNLFAQTIMMFLTISGFINIFTPFSIQKEITRDEIDRKAFDAIEEQKKRDEVDERIRRNTTLG